MVTFSGECDACFTFFLGPLSHIKLAFVVWKVQFFTSISRLLDSAIETG